MFHKITCAAAVVCLLLVHAGNAAQDKPDAAKELKKLEGDWDVLTLVIAGEESAEIKDAKMVFLIRGDKITVKKDDKVLAETSIMLDTAPMPQLIDLTSISPEKGKKHFGIYELKGDDLKICVHLGGRDRTTEFTAKEQSIALITLKRVKQ